MAEIRVLDLRIQIWLGMQIARDYSQGEGCQEALVQT